MAGKLLILSFHGASGPGVKTSLLDEDLLFKKALAPGTDLAFPHDSARAEGAIDPSGVMWRVVDSQGTMKKVGQMPAG
jgi:hypothetical protein